MPNATTTHSFKIVTKEGEMDLSHMNEYPISTIAQVVHVMSENSVRKKETVVSTWLKDAHGWVPYPTQAALA